MDITLENKLAEKYSFMRRENSKRQNPYSVYGNFGCMIKDGWYQILDELCGEIWAAYKEAGITSDLVVDEIGVSSAVDAQHVVELTAENVKYHELVFRYHMSDVKDSGVDAMKEKMVLEATQAVRERIDALIEQYRVKSRTICEECGGQGVLRQRGKEIAVWCEACYAC
ncbi:MAG: hypothetical protein IJ794_06225 [Lachnospiraceae bacterium]|nr:hypothetical protein [Lachnospiraceae bacterium]